MALPDVLVVSNCGNNFCNSRIPSPRRSHSHNKRPPCDTSINPEFPSATTPVHKVVSSGAPNRFHACHPAIWPIVVFLCIGGVIHYLQEPTRSFGFHRINWDDIPRYKMKLGLERRLNVTKTDYWIVVTSIHVPQEAVRRLTTLNGWQVVVVGDKKTPKNWTLPGVIFLSIRDQAKLGYRIHDHIPYKSYARKNIGYLFAIQHGAKVIYETDDDNILLVADLRDGFDVDLSQPAKGQLLMYNSQKGRSVVNPYVHFGQPSMWPRGLPLDSVARNGPEPSYTVADSSAKPLIQQGLANGDPDVDAIYRLTRVSSGRPIRVQFDSEALPVAIPPGTMCPFNSQNTLFHRDALWGLLIPVTTTFRVCDIWRGYWVQRLLADIGGVLAFYPPSVRQDRNIHNYFSDFVQEKDMYMDTRSLINFLLAWKSNAPHLFDRALSIIRQMALRGYWQHKDVDLAAAWFADLIAVGYQPPKPLTGQSQRSELPPMPINGQDQLSGSRQFNKAKKKKAKSVSTNGGPKIKHYETKSLRSTYLDSGPQDHRVSALQNLSEMQVFFRRIVLILNVNNARDIRNAVGFWRAVYGRLFDHVVVVSEAEDREWGVQGYPFTGGPNASEQAGFHAHSVLPGVMARFPRAEGFLWTNDDLILNYWNLRGANKTKIWFLGTHHREWFVEPLATFNFTKDPFTWWRLPDHYQRTLKSLRLLNRKYVKRYKKSLAEGGLSDSMAQVKAIADTYYLPRRHVAAATDIIRSFVKARLLSEVAVPTMLCALDSPINFDPHALQDIRYLWHEERDEDPSTKYSVEGSGFHPWKLRTRQQQEEALVAMAEGDPTLG